VQIKRLSPDATKIAAPANPDACLVAGVSVDIRLRAGDLAISRNMTTQQEVPQC
jgi:hypothetical protein